MQASTLRSDQNRYRKPLSIALDARGDCLPAQPQQQPVSALAVLALEHDLAQEAVDDGPACCWLGLRLGVMYWKCVSEGNRTAAAAARAEATRKKV